MEREYQKLIIKGLFGSVDHEIVFSPDSRITILAGPNGCGKTHVLRLYRALLGLDIMTLMASPYKSLEVFLADGSELKAERKEDEEDSPRLELTGISPEGKKTPVAHFRAAELQADSFEDDLPPYIRETVDGRAIDVRNGRLLSRRHMEQRYGYRTSVEHIRRNTMSDHPWLGEFVPEVAPVLIDTKRLDTGAYSQASAGVDAPLIPGTGQRGAVGRIGEYIEQVRHQISDARNESLHRSQQADEKFVATLLKRSRATVNKERLKARYQTLSDMHAELNENGLTGQAAAVQLPADTNPTERRVLNVFIEDWEKKLAPLMPVNDKLKLLRRIINEKFIRKSLSFDPKGQMRFTSQDGVTVSVDQLSSGEQHLLALFTMLLFSADPGSIVLIDEPEISLHAAWKHAFVHDIEQVAELSRLSVIMATHSSAVINGKWDLVQELRLSN